MITSQKFRNAMFIARLSKKVPKQTLGGDAEKNDFTECATINDLTIMKGRETPKNQALTIPKGFSTVSADMCIF